VGEADGVVLGVYYFDLVVEGGLADLFAVYLDCDGAVPDAFSDFADELQLINPFPIRPIILPRKHFQIPLHLNPLPMHHPPHPLPKHTLIIATSRLRPHYLTNPLLIHRLRLLILLMLSAEYSPIHILQLLHHHIIVILVLDFFDYSAHVKIVSGEFVDSTELDVLEH